MAAKALPACVLTGASGRQLEVLRSGFQPFCSIVSSGDGGQTVCVERGGSSPAPSWREPDSVAPHPGPESALRYFGNERWGGPRARQSWKGTGPLLEGGAGLVLGSGSLMDQEPA